MAKSKGIAHAERAGMSKQAMNRLLGSLEVLGYIVRSDARDEGRARIVLPGNRGPALLKY
jgi:DNA-binding MarR family transcriptional regulator